MLQPTFPGEIRPESDAAGPAAALPVAEFDARIDALHEALRTVLLNGRRSKPSGALDKAALAVLHTVSDRQPCRAADLAICTGLDASTISRHIKVLLDTGLIDQHPDPADARARLLAPTDEGANTLARVRAARLAQSRRALASWTPEDLDTLTTLLRRFGAAIEPEDS